MKNKTIIGIFLNCLLLTTSLNATILQSNNHKNPGSDNKGDAIHLARSMANTFDKTYFDVFDDCPEEIRPRAASNTLNAIVQPNPTKGELNIVLENPFTGTIEMFDITGKLVYSDRCENIFEKTIHLNLNEGVFMMKITSIDGESDIEKVIVTK